MEIETFASIKSKEKILAIKPEKKKKIEEGKLNYSIITCDKCFSIPKIIFLSKNEISIECQKCQSKDIKNITYFDKFMKELEDNNFIDLPNCSFNKEHNYKSFKYCIQCTKYLCKDCIKIHNISYGEKNHILIGQKMENQYYCSKEGHTEYIIDHFCTKCNDYLCPKCKCEHNQKEIYSFDDIEKVKEIERKVKKCEEIIENEEKKLNELLNDLNNRIITIKKMFNEYKERNMKIISLYKLLIDNYKHINSIRNYNISNNIIINDNFDLNSSDDFYIKNDNLDKNECLSSKYNKLCNFYSNKNHIKTNIYSEYLITKKFCNKKKVKKCIIIDNDKIVFIFEDDNFIHYLYNMEPDQSNMINSNQYKHIKYSTSNIIKDIIPLKESKFILLNILKQAKVLQLKGGDINIIYEDKEEFKNIDYFLVDKFDENNFFSIQNYDNKLMIKYCLLKSYNCESNLISFFCNSKFLLVDIGEEIVNSKIREEDKKLLINLFSFSQFNDNLSDLLHADDKLKQLIDERIKKLYNSLETQIETDNDKKEYILNSEYMIYKLLLDKGIDKLAEKDINELNYLSVFYNFCLSLRKKYCYYLVLNSKINNIYNYNNNKFIFMGEKYLFIIYSLKKREFLRLETSKFLYLMMRVAIIILK